MERLWTTAEVARCLGINEADVEGLVRQGKLTGYRLGGQFLRFRPDQVEMLKGKVKFQPNAITPAVPRKDGWLHHVQEFVYFYDFYLVSATFLALLVIYLIASG
jgi:excisionase family DNA binding protein